MISHIREGVQADTISEDEALMLLGDEYQGYCELEYRFEHLLRNENVLELWRESRRAA